MTMKYGNLMRDKMLLSYGFEKPITPLPLFPQCTLIASQSLRNLCFSFFLGITAVLREIKNNAYAKFWAANKVVKVAYSRFHPSKRERETAFFTPGPN